MTEFFIAGRSIGMDPWSDQDLELDRLAAERERKRRHASRGPSRIVLPRKARLPHRDEMARTIATMRELAEFVGELRAGLEIPQARLAARAGVSRQWLVALEQGRPTLEAGKVLATLEALGFEITLTPYTPPPPWMLREMQAAEQRREMVAREARRRRNGQRTRAKQSRLAQNAEGVGLDLG